MQDLFIRRGFEELAGMGRSFSVSEVALKMKERPLLAPLSVFALGMCLAAGMLPEASIQLYHRW
jgi:hypothetical protein